MQTFTLKPMHEIIFLVFRFKVSIPCQVWANGGIITLLIVVTQMYGGPRSNVYILHQNIKTNSVRHKPLLHGSITHNVVHQLCTQTSQNMHYKLNYLLIKCKVEYAEIPINIQISRYLDVQFCTNVNSYGSVYYICYYSKLIMKRTIELNIQTFVYT